MFWLIFTAVDLYIGVVALDLMKGTVPVEKLPRLAVMKKILIMATLMVVAMIVWKWVRSFDGGANASVRSTPLKMTRG